MMSHTPWPRIIARATGRLRCSSEQQREELLRRHGADPAVRKAPEKSPLVGDELVRLAEEQHGIQEARRGLDRLAEEQERRDVEAAGAQRAATERTRVARTP
jgi:hypothetical protein